MNDTTEFSDRQTTLLPRGTNDLLKLAAQRQYKRPSQYVREIILQKLVEDGFCLIPTNNQKVA
jgi:hypothetical protein